MNGRAGNNGGPYCGPPSKGSVRNTDPIDIQVRVKVMTIADRHRVQFTYLENSKISHEEVFPQQFNSFAEADAFAKHVADTVAMGLPAQGGIQ